MPSLLDHIDRLTHTSEAIQQAAASVFSHKTGPFTKAVLHTQLGDLARDIDSSELGLFTLVTASATRTHALETEPTNAEKSTLARVAFPGATPLRKPLNPRDNPRQSLEKEPEVYARAALKYLEQYDVVRSMPRARQEVLSILEKLNSVREQITILGGELAHSSHPESQSKESVAGEERKIRELQTKIKQLGVQKDALVANGRQLRTDMGRRHPSSSPQGIQEDSFWNPAPASAFDKPFRSPALPKISGENLLMETDIDLGNTSLTSSVGIETPVPPSRMFTNNASRPHSSSPIASPSPALASMRKTAGFNEEDQLEQELELPNRADHESALNASFVSSQVLSGVASSSPGASQVVAEINSKQMTPSRPLERRPETPSDMKRSKFKVTRETEAIVAKIWSAVGDIIMPGHPFNTATMAIENKPPRAKETIALLQNLANQSPSVTSPSTHSTMSQAPIHRQSGAPTVYQVILAHMLVILLSSPNYSISLKDLKEALTARATLLNVPTSAGLGLNGQGTETRVLYGCVAKRLVKIDRGASVQTVRYDF